jgi:branched-chain amino acid transport system ATP-binding protein
VLRLDDIHAGYGPSEVLKGISLTLNAGEIVALLGANGAGKTTTLLTIAGVVKPRGGKLFWQNEPLTEDSADRVLARGICLCPEGRRIFPRLTVRENLLAGGYLWGAKGSQAKLERIFNYFPVLAERQGQLGGTLSGGEQQMLAIGRSLMSEPKALLLDEPSLGLAPQIVHRIFGILQEINREGISILLVEQNAREALRIAQRGYVLVTGKIQIEDTAANLLASDEVRQAYLGEDDI